MHVNHAKEFLKSVHSEALFSQLFDQAFTPLCKEPGILTSKLFDLMSLFGQDLPKNHLADYICDNCAASSLQSPRIQPNQWFLDRSGQNELMRSNNFDIKIPGSLHTEVEAQANNC